MAFKVHVGPPQIAIHQGQTVLVSEPDGQINWPSEKGLYFLDTRIVSNWAIYANGEPWELLNGGAINYHAAHHRPHDQSIDRRRHARRSRHHQQQPEAGAFSARGRAAMRLCRRLRGEVG